MTDEEIIRWIEALDADEDSDETIEAELEGLSQARATVISEFPGLIGLDEYLPDGLGDELRTDLTAFVQAIPALNRPADRRAEMLTAYNAGDMDTYNRLYQEVVHAPDSH